MEILKGTAVSPGIVIGEVFVLDIEEYRMPRRAVPPEQIEAEVARFQSAAKKVQADLEKDISRVKAMWPEGDLADMFKGHYGMLTHDLVPKVIDSIRKYRFTPEHAVSKHVRTFVKRMQANDEEGSFARRVVADLTDVEKRLFRALFGLRGQAHESAGHKSVIFAKELTPSQTISLDRSKILGFVTELGGKTSHTAILAKAQGIPAVVGIPNVTREVSGGDTVIVDGSQGFVIIDPDEKTLKMYRAKERNYIIFEKQTAEEMRSLPSETRDGIAVALHANIELPEEAVHAREYGAGGIGLFRTEFLFFDSKRTPTERDHYDAYRKIIHAMEGRPVTIRALDVGADKDIEGMPREANPFLGCRGIRYLFEKMDLFRTQLRAVLRASAEGKIRLMFPMVSTVDEMKQARAILADVREELEREGARFDPEMPVGVMIEVPSAAIAADILAVEADFFSIGTNDLVQYVLAVDRVNEKISALYQPGHPAVLRLIKMVLEAGQRAERPVSMCGEMSGDPLYTTLLLGLGLRNFSAVPSGIPEVKKVLRSVTIAEAKQVAAEAMAMTDTHQIVDFLTERTKRIIPELF